MQFVWWLLIIAAALALVYYAYGHTPAPAAGGAGRGDADVPPGADNNAGFMRDDHGRTEFSEELGFGREPGGPAKVAESPDLFPDRTGAATASALGARELPDGRRRDGAADHGGTETGWDPGRLTAQAGEEAGEARTGEDGAAEAAAGAAPPGRGPED